MARYKIGFIPKHLPYQEKDVYTVELVMKSLGGIPCSNIVYESENIQDCMKKLKELNAEKRKRKVGGNSEK